MKNVIRMPELPDISDVFRATAPGAGEQPPLTFYVAVSPDYAPLEMRRARAAAVVQTALLAMRPIGLDPAATAPAEVVSFSEMRHMGVSKTEAARIFEDPILHHWVPHPIFIVPDPAPYLKAWSAISSGRIEA